MVYYVNIVALFIMNLLLSSDNKKHRRILCTIETLFWVLISGLRSVFVGVDTIRYEIMFYDVKSLSWTRIFSNMQYYLSSGSNKDPGYDLFVKICQIFTSDYQIYLVIVACIIFVPMGVWIYKYSEDPCISFLIFSGLFYSFLATTGIRQSMVMSLVVFLGYDFLVKNKNKTFIALVFLSAFIHKSALLALLYIPIKKVRAANWRLLLTCLFSIILFIFRTRYTLIASSFLGFENYAIQQEGANPITFSITYLFLIVLILFYCDKIIRGSNEASTYINAVYVGLLCLPMVFVNQSAMRALHMYSIFMLLLIPLIFNKMFANNYRLAGKCILFVVIGAMLYMNNPQYTFYWQV